MKDEVDKIIYAFSKKWQKSENTDTERCTCENNRFDSAIRGMD